MKKFEANCLEKVYELATAEYNCSITELEIEIIQQPSKGFLGFGKKNAIIQVCFKDKCKVYVQETKVFRNKDVQIQSFYIHGIRKSRNGILCGRYCEIKKTTSMWQL